MDTFFVWVIYTEPVVNLARLVERNPLLGNHRPDERATRSQLRREASRAAPLPRPLFNGRYRI